jgi:hypothetical protein
MFIDIEELAENCRPLPARSGFARHNQQRVRCRSDLPSRSRRQTTVNMYDPTYCVLYPLQGGLVAYNEKQNGSCSILRDIPLCLSQP